MLMVGSGYQESDPALVIMEVPYNWLEVNIITLLVEQGL